MSQRLFENEVLNDFRRKGENGYLLKDGKKIAYIGRNTKANTFTFGVDEDDQNILYINLSDNENLTKVVFTKPLKNLVHLDLSDSKVKEITFPKGFDNLEWLDISRNQLDSIELKGDMPNLEYLDLSGNKLQKFHLPFKFENLKYFYLNDNELHIFSSKSLFNSLEILHLAENNLTELPEAEYSKLQTLYLKGNPLENYEEALIAGDDSGNALEIIGLLRARFQSGEQPNYRARLIIVGNGRIGKTCLVNRLRGEPCEDEHGYTHGISIKTLNERHLPQIEAPEVHLKVWDFGGQEVFYATHQFFMSEEAIYIYAWTDEVIAIRNKENDVKHAPQTPYDIWRDHEYWLENIRMHGEKSAIQVVKTHCLEAKGVFPFEKLKTKYELDIEPLDFDGKSSEAQYLVNLKSNLSSLINRLPLFRKPFPKNYYNVIEAIELKRESGIKELTKNDFGAIAQEKKVDERDYDKLLSYLKKTGEVIYFPDNPKLKHRIFIDPVSLTQKIYKLIEHNDELLQKEGIFDEAYAELKLGWSDWEVMLELLISFELVFRKKSKGEIVYVAPQYLPNLPSSGSTLSLFDGHKNQFLFQLKYPDFLPENVMVNVLCNYGPYSLDSTFRDGIHFRTENATTGCLIELDEPNRTIQVFADADQNYGQVAQDVFEKFVQLSKKATLLIADEKGENWIDSKVLKNAREQDKDLINIDGTYLEDSSIFDFLFDRKELSKFNNDHSNFEKNETMKEKIQQLVIKNRFEDAIDLLKNCLPSDYQGIVVKLKSDYKKLERDSRMGILHRDQENVERSRISASILDLANKYGEKEEVRIIPKNEEIEPKSIMPESQKKTNMNLIKWALGLFSLMFLGLLFTGTPGTIEIPGVMKVALWVPEEITPTQTKVTVIGKIKINGVLVSKFDDVKVTGVSLKNINTVNKETPSGDIFRLKNVPIPKDKMYEIQVEFSNGKTVSAIKNITEPDESGRVDVGIVEFEFKTEKNPTTGKSIPTIIFKPQINNNNIIQNQGIKDSDNSGNIRINQ